MSLIDSYTTDKAIDSLDWVRLAAAFELAPDVDDRDLAEELALAREWLARGSRSLRGMAELILARAEGGSDAGGH